MKILVVRSFQHDEQTGLLTSGENNQEAEISAVIKNMVNEDRKSLTFIVHAPTTSCRKSVYSLGVGMTMPLIQANCLDWDPSVTNISDTGIKGMIAYYEKYDIPTIILVPHDNMVNRICEWAISERVGQITERVDLTPGQCCLVREDGTYALIPR